MESRLEAGQNHKKEKGKEWVCFSLSAREPGGAGADGS